MTTSLIQNLNNLLVLAQNLDDALVGRTKREKNKAINSIFVRMQGNLIIFEQKNVTRYFIWNKKPYDIKANFRQIQKLFAAISKTSVNDLKFAHFQLKHQGLHKHIKNPAVSLITCKDRLNALLSHVAAGKNQVRELESYKIAWQPNSQVIIPILQAAKRKIEFCEYSWMKDETCLKYMFYEFARAFTHLVEPTEAIEAVSRLPLETRKQLCKLCNDDQFFKELGQILKIKKHTWEFVKDCLYNLSKW